MADLNVLSVGQCGYDHRLISRFLESEYSAEVLNAEDFQEAVETLRTRPCALVLVNRVTDSDGTSGLDLIRTLKSDPELASIAVMLVSNIAPAQDQAVELGAIRGFGKSDLRGTEVRRLLDPLLGTSD